MTDNPAPVSRFVLVTGPSGVGRPTAINMLPDLGLEAIRNPPLLLRRFAEVWRRPPPAPAVKPEAGIRRKEDLLGPLRERADYLVDVSELGPHGLRAGGCWFASLARVTALLDLVPRACCEKGNAYFAVGSGCTAGQHHSAGVPEALANRLAGAGRRVSVRYGEVGRRGSGPGRQAEVRPA